MSPASNASLAALGAAALAGGGAFVASSGGLRGSACGPARGACAPGQDGASAVNAAGYIVAALAGTAGVAAAGLAGRRRGRPSASAVLRRAEPVSAAVAAAAAASKAAAVAGGGKAVAGAAGTITFTKRGGEGPAYEPFGPGPFDPSKQIGALPPLGYWDPAGLTKDEATFRTFRTAEIKHARVAMMASIGLVAQHSFRFPSFDFSTPSGVAALTDPQAGQGLAVLFLVAGFYELNLWTESEDKAPGDFGDPASWRLSFPGLADERGLFSEDIRNRELNNGRFAMMAVMGIFAAEYQTGLDGVDQFSAAVARWQQMGGFENF